MAVRQLREMPARRVGIGGVVVIAIVMLLSTNVSKIDQLTGHQTHYAELAESGGLRSGDDVRVNGVSVGRVKKVELGEEHVKVEFSVDGRAVGDRTSAQVKSSNALGRKYFALELAGSGDVDLIPVERTDPGYSLNDRLGELTNATGEIDTDQLQASLRSVSEVLKETPTEFRDALDGVGRLSRVIAHRDEDLALLLDSASGVSKVLADRNQQISAILTNGSTVLQQLVIRRAVVGELLRNVRAAARQLEGLADDNKETLRPALRKLYGAADLLADNRASLEYAVRNLGGFARALGEAVGSGPFFMAYLQNLNGANFTPELPGLLGDVSAEGN